ncbi:MAG: hypothetical protein Hyperionvirus26_26 [Hyperionvirus sp.]|uniref:Tetratricopeptide repeat protein n=1 Tax=Hyperionvirus sp. TaxID=2487770 RepID=A0A3G5ADX2_9VIRU|nr:MAG: hypothetical protein Hyperionvirus26_26 [Hyperionvirus sp.]
MGAKTSTPVVNLAKLIAEGKGSILESIELKREILCLTDDERKHVALMHHDNSEVMIVIGEIYEDLKNYEYARQLYEIAMRGKHGRGYFRLGLLKFSAFAELKGDMRTKSMEEGFRMISEAADLGDIEGLIWMGKSYKRRANWFDGDYKLFVSMGSEGEILRLSDWDRAEKYFLDALDIDCGRGDAVSGLMDLYSDNVPVERRWVQRLWRADKKVWAIGEVYEMLGAVYLRKGCSEKSLECYRKALEFDPKCWGVMFAIAVKHKVDAEKLLLKAAENGHRESMIYLNRAYRNGVDAIGENAEKAHRLNKDVLKLNEAALMCEIAYYYRVKKMFLHSLKILVLAKDLTVGADSEEIEKEINEILVEHRGEILSQLTVIDLDVGIGLM